MTTEAAEGIGPIDLHTHSTASDGMLAPAQLVALAVERGLAVLALTDHDTVAGIAEAAEAAEAAGLRFPTGVPTAIIRLWFSAQPRPVAESGIFTGDFVVDNFFWLDRLQPAYREWSRATGGSAVEMHIYGPPEIIALPDATLLARAVTDVYRAFPELRGQLLHARLLRNAATHTLFQIGEPDLHLGIETPWPGLYACGDWVYHPTPALYLERATVTGIAAANSALAARGQQPWPLLDHPSPEWLAGALAGMFRRVRLGLLRHKQAKHKKL